MAESTFLGMTLTPITRRRLANFRANKRGYWSLWIFIFLFVFSLFAELIANDKPLVVRYQGETYFPILKSYPATTFGGQLYSEPDYADPVIRKLINDRGWAIYPIIPYGLRTVDFWDYRPLPSPPSARHWLGTDDQGRDVLARLIYGFRISVLFGLTLTLVSSVVGIAAGALQGYFGGLFDLVFQRVIEVWQGIPRLYVLIIFASFVEPSFWWLLIILLFFHWMSLVSVVRAEFLRARNLDYAKAALALGASDMTIMIKHLLPNAMVAALTFLPFVLNSSITALTSLDFLGFGLPPGSASLGEVLAQGKANLQAPWLGISGFLVLATMLSLLIFIGEAVRDAFDPRKSLG